MKNISGDANWDLSGKKVSVKEKVKQPINKIAEISDDGNYVTLSEDILATIIDLRKKLKHSYSLKPIKETYDAIATIEYMESCIK